MTVCLASDGYPPTASGIAQFNWHLVKLLTAKGHSVVQLNIDRTTTAPDKTITNGLFTQVWLAKTFQIHYQYWLAYFKEGGIDAAFWIAVGLSMREWLLANANSYAIDVIEASDFGGYAAFLSDEALPPLFITGHASMLQLGQYNFKNIKEETYQLLLQLEQISYDNASGIITHSSINLKSIKKLTQTPVFSALMPWSNFESLIDLDGTTEPTVLSIGNLQPVKGVDVLLQALRLVDDKSIVVKWIGADSYHSAEFPEYSLYLKHQYPDVWDNTFFWIKAESHEGIIQQISNADILVATSLFETFGYTALEGAYCKKAIILTDAIGASQHFTDKLEALIIPANDPQRLADAINLLVRSEDYRIGLGKNAYSKLIKQFDAAEIVRRRLDIYQKTLTSGQLQGTGYKRAVAILSKYETLPRKLYFKLKARIKKLLIW